MKRATEPCFVEGVQNRRITIACRDRAHVSVLKQLGGARSVFGHRWRLRAETDEELARMLAALRDNEFAFAGATSGWPPAEVFSEMRERGLLDGAFAEIVWRAPNDPVIVER